MIKAELNNYRQSPRKVRAVANAIKGKKVTEAMNALAFIPKVAALPLRKLVLSALANAEHNFKMDKDSLVVKELRVDGGAILYRRMPRARGTAYPIRKRTSHVTLVLDVAPAASKKDRPAKAEKAAKAKA